MQSLQNETIGDMLRNIKREAKTGPFTTPPKDENPTERAHRIFREIGGPLLGWLGDEAHKRGHSFTELAATLNVTEGYILQLCAGVRKVENASQEFFVACSRYLGVPAVVCKLLAGSIQMADFLYRAESEEEAVDRAVRQMLDDPAVRSSLPANVLALDTETKRALVLMYSEVSSNDFLGTKQLPNIVFWLQRAAMLVDDANYQAWRDLQD